MTKSNNTNFPDKKRPEHLYRLTFENAAVGIAHIGKDGRFLTLNNKVAEITGYPKEELLQKTFQEITHPADLEMDVKQTKAMYRGEINSYSMEKRYVRKDGSIVWVKLTASAVFDKNDEFEMFVGVIEDISEKKKTEEALYKVLKQYKIASSAAKIGAFYRNIKTGEDHWSPEFLALYGLKQGDAFLFKDEIPDAVHPDDCEKVRQLAKQHYDNSDGTEFNSDHRIILPDGTIRWVNVRAVTECDAKNNPSKTYGITMDITERKQGEIALRKSESKYRTLFNSIDEGFCICEMLIDQKGKPYDYRWLEINPAWEKQTGLKDPVGKTALGLVPDLEQHWIDIFGKVVLTGEPVHFQQGSEAMGRWFDVYSFPVGEPHLYQFGILFNDITARKTAEIKLKENEKKFRTLANNISQLSWMADNKAKIFWYNKRWLEFTGNDPGKIEGWGYKKIIHPDHRKRLQKTVAQAIKTEEAWEELVPLQNKDGDYKWFLFRVIPVWDELRNSLRWFGTATDITKQHTIEELLKKEKELVENLLYIAAHDLKGPVANMFGFLDIMDKISPEEKLTFLQYFRQSAEQLDKTIKGITDMLRVRDIDKSSASLVYAEGLLYDILLEFKDELIPSSVHRNFAEKPSIRYIEPFLYSIFKNLMSNAIKYSREHIPLRIEISMKKEGTYTLLTFSDNGIGIDMDKYGKKLFSPFQRLEVKKAKGTGIGLYLIKDIIERNGGYIKVESTPGEGTTFYCYLQEY